nr:uncharacterized protein LOC121471092 [Taeniopygia guttata]
MSLDLRIALHPSGKSGLKRRNRTESPDAAFQLGEGVRAVLPAPGLLPTGEQAVLLGGSAYPKIAKGTGFVMGSATPTEIFGGLQRWGTGDLPAPHTLPWQLGSLQHAVPAPHPGLQSPPIFISWRWLPALLPCWPPYATLVALSSEIPAISRLHRRERDVSEHISSGLTREERSPGSGPCACSLSRPRGGTGVGMSARGVGQCWKWIVGPLLAGCNAMAGQDGMPSLPQGMGVRCGRRGSLPRHPCLWKPLCHGRVLLPKHLQEGSCFSRDAFSLTESWSTFHLCPWDQRSWMPRSRHPPASRELLQRGGFGVHLGAAVP